MIQKTTVTVVRVIIIIVYCMHSELYVIVPLLQDNSHSILKEENKPMLVISLSVEFQISALTFHMCLCLDFFICNMAIREFIS